MKFKNEELKEHLEWLDWRLREILIPEIERMADVHGYDCWFTSAVRDDGIHAAKSASGYRAADLDFTDDVATEDEVDAFGRFVANWITARYIYGRGWDGRLRPSAYWHENRGSPGFHLHLQVPGGDLKIPALNPDEEIRV